MEWLVSRSQNTTNADKYVEKRKFLVITGGVINWYGHYEKEHGGSSTIKNGTTYESAIPLLGIYPQEMKSLCRRDICTLCSWPHYLLLSNS